MKRSNFCVLKERIPAGTTVGAPVFTAADHNDKLGEHTQVGIQVVLTDVSGSGGFDLWLEHSGSQRDWIGVTSQSTIFTAGTGDISISGPLGSGLVTQFFSSALRGLHGPMLSAARFRIQFSDATTSAHVEVHVTQRDDAGGVDDRSEATRRSGSDPALLEAAASSRCERCSDDLDGTEATKRCGACRDGRISPETASRKRLLRSGLYAKLAVRAARLAESAAHLPSRTATSHAAETHGALEWAGAPVLYAENYHDPDLLAPPPTGRITVSEAIQTKYDRVLVELANLIGALDPPTVGVSYTAWRIPSTLPAAPVYLGGSSGGTLDRLFQEKGYQNVAKLPTNPTSTPVPMSEFTVIDVKSLSKTVTAIALMFVISKFAEVEDVAGILEKNIYSYLPTEWWQSTLPTAFGEGYQLRDAAALNNALNQIKVRDLLYHTSGLDSTIVTHRLAASDPSTSRCEHDPSLLLDILAHPIDGGYGYYNYDLANYNLLRYVIVCMWLLHGHEEDPAMFRDPSQSVDPSMFRFSLLDDGLDDSAALYDTIMDQLFASIPAFGLTFGIPTLHLQDALNEVRAYPPSKYIVDGLPYVSFAAPSGIDAGDSAGDPYWWTGWKTSMFTFGHFLGNVIGGQLFPQRFWAKMSERFLAPVSGSDPLPVAMGFDSAPANELPHVPLGTTVFFKEGDGSTSPCFHRVGTVNNGHKPSWETAWVCVEDLLITIMVNSTFVGHAYQGKLVRLVATAIKNSDFAPSSIAGPAPHHG